MVKEVSMVFDVEEELGNLKWREKPLKKGKKRMVGLMQKLPFKVALDDSYLMLYSIISSNQTWDRFSELDDMLNGD